MKGITSRRSQPSPSVPDADGEGVVGGTDAVWARTMVEVRRHARLRARRFIRFSTCVA
jgi:hypothetical protein